MSLRTSPKRATKRFIQTPKSLEDSLKLLELVPSFQGRVKMVRERIKIPASLPTSVSEEETKKYFDWLHERDRVFLNSDLYIQGVIAARSLRQERKITEKEMNSQLEKLKNGSHDSYLKYISEKIASEYHLSPSCGFAIKHYICFGTFVFINTNYLIETRSSQYGGIDVCIRLFGNLSVREKKEVFDQAELLFQQVHPDLSRRHAPYHRIDRDIKIYKTNMNKINLELKNSKEIADHTWPEEDMYEYKVDLSKRKKSAIKKKQERYTKRRAAVVRKALSTLKKAIKGRFPKHLL